jgi:hypothetical protein
VNTSSRIRILPKPVDFEELLRLVEQIAGSAT